MATWAAARYEIEAVANTHRAQWSRRSLIEVECLQLLEVLQLDAVDLLKEDLARDVSTFATMPAK